MYLDIVQKKRDGRRRLALCGLSLHGWTLLRPALSQQNPLSRSGLKSLGHHVDHGDNRDGQRGAGGLQYIDFLFPPR